MYQALHTIGFDVKRIPTFTVYNQPETPATHTLLIVKVKEKSFLVDVGFGYNAIRYPLEFSFKKTEERLLAPNERYRLTCTPDVFQFSMYIKQSWVSFYHFQNPIKGITYDQFLKNNQKMFEYQGEIPVRDRFMKFGKVTENERIGFHIELRKTPVIAFQIRIDAYGKNDSKIFYQNYSSFSIAVQDCLEIRMPKQNELKAFHDPCVEGGAASLETVKLPLGKITRGEVKLFPKGSPEEQQLMGDMKILSKSP